MKRIFIIFAVLYAFGCRSSEAQPEVVQDPAKMPLSQLDVGLEYSVNGVLIVQKERKILPAELRNKINDGMTIMEIVDVIGPGWVSQLSGIGSIAWVFNDGVELRTVWWPGPYGQPLNLIKRDRGVPSQNVQMAP